MESLFASLLFFLVVSATCFLPGGLLLWASFGKDASLELWERIVFAFGISSGFLIFGMMALGEAGISLRPLPVLLLLFAGAPIATGILFLVRRLLPASPRSAAGTQTPLTFTRKQGLLFLLVIAATLLIKTSYLADAVLPTATDLGHHMYWAKLISDTGELPVYAEQNIAETDGRYAITAPEPIADFIIGEHLPFAAIEILGNFTYFSAFPVVFLGLVNLLALLALALLAAAFVKGLQATWLPPRIWNRENAFLVALFLFGPLYTLASPQEKFVSGGVVGNTFGILFIPLILLALYRGLRERDSRFLGLGVFLVFTLAYIHHLSSFMLAFALVAIVLLYLAFHWRRALAVLRGWLRLACHPATVGVLLLGTLFFFLVSMPTYIETGAVDTAVGTPTKNTRIGLTLDQVAHSAGPARAALGLAALALLVSLPWRQRYAAVFLCGWSAIWLIMTLRPHWLFVDIPSNRIGAYVSLPLGVAAALGCLALFALLRERASWPVPPRFAGLLFLLVFAFALGSGFADNAATLLPQGKGESAAATFHATRFLAEESGPENRIVKDHNYITADAWMKLFFMRDYSYPLSRAFFSRYETNPDRERCTLAMISTPNTPLGGQCFEETETDIVVVSSVHDSAQFEASDDFSKLYASKYVSIFKRQPYAD